MTVALDPASQDRFDRLRKRLFPVELNYLSAHVTVFHHLPGEHWGEILHRVTEVCGDVPITPFAVTGLRFLGRGTAFSLHMPGVAAVRQRLAAEWQPWLTAQDRQPWKPHVTVQNKVAAASARASHAELQAQPLPDGGHATGLQLWAYVGGPWEPLSTQPFERHR